MSDETANKTITLSRERAEKIEQAVRLGEYIRANFREYDHFENALRIANAMGLTPD